MSTDDCPTASVALKRNVYTDPGASDPPLMSSEEVFSTVWVTAGGANSSWGGPETLDHRAAIGALRVVALTRRRSGALALTCGVQADKSESRTWCGVDHRNNVVLPCRGFGRYGRNHHTCPPLPAYLTANLIPCKRTGAHRSVWRIDDRHHRAGAAWEKVHVAVGRGAARALRHGHRDVVLPGRKALEHLVMRNKGEAGARVETRVRRCLSRSTTDVSACCDLRRRVLLGVAVPPKMKSSARVRYLSAAVRTCAVALATSATLVELLYAHGVPVAADTHAHE